MLLWGEGSEDELGKAKNIKQTEMLVDLREAILQVSRHFQSIDPKNNKVVSNLSVEISFTNGIQFDTMIKGQVS